MAILLGIAISDAEYYVNPKSTIRTAEQLAEAKDIDVMLAYDEYSNLPFLKEFREHVKRNLYYLKVTGFGLGKARNSLAVEAWRRKYDCLVLSDSHMKFYGDIDKSLSELCKEYAAVPVQTDQKEIARDVGIYLYFYSFNWGHYFDADEIPMTANPLTAWSFRALDDLISAQGMFTPVLYWGYELFDPSVSLARLGRWLKVRKDVIVGHWYREQGELGKQFDVRNSQPIHKEPFALVSIIKKDLPYYAGIKHAAATYALKHYKPILGNITSYGFRKLSAVDPMYTLVQPPEVINAIKRFNSVAKYTILDVYNEFQKRVNSGRIKISPPTYLFL